MELFVPGRVCLVGEHSDWAGKFRTFNDTLCEGMTVVTGTNQGLYARVRKHPSKVVVTSTDNDGNKSTTEMSMDAETLLGVARGGGHWSYVAGVAYKMLEEHVVGGIEIDNYMTTLPLKKGLSSSAAICVLAARAFNKLYDLRLTTRGEMEYAYQGELVTPSQCGRLDQACAFGSTPVLMSYDGEFTSVEKILVAVELHFVVVDLCAEKSTVDILNGLRAAFPVAATQEHRDLQFCLGKSNKDIAQRLVALLTATPSTATPNTAAAARTALTREETVRAIGALLSEAQAAFDKYATPLCPSELVAPVLHRCLSHPSLQPLITGGKGVGAGGDGTAQLLCLDASAQNEVARIVKDELGMDPLLLTVTPGSKIATAVIPAGGFAGTLFPASQACKAELFPIYDPRDGMCKPLILGTVEQLLDAGLERVVLVVQPEDLVHFRRLFQEPVTPGNARRLPGDHDGQAQSYARKLIDMGRHVEFVVQEQQMGYGHAVHCAKDAVGAGPFLLVLGHHVYLSAKDSALTCVEQVLEAHKTLGTNVVGLMRTKGESVCKFGTAAGTLNADGVLTVTAVEEKPSLEYARQNLRVASLDDDEFLTMFGMYALDAAIFDVLGDFIEHDLRGKAGDIPFTPALEQLRQQRGLAGIIVNGERLPINSPESFITTNTRLLALSSASSSD